LISIIVDNYNRSYLLPLVMQAYTRENFTKSPVEMIIVDDDSEPHDHFVDYLRLGLDTIKPWFRVRAFETHHSYMNVGRTLNVGVKQSEGDIIIFNHSDMVPLHPNNLELVWKNHQETDWLYLTPTLLGSKPRVNLPPDKLQMIGHVLPAGASMPRKLFDKAGGFDERFRGYGPVDTDLAHRIYYGQGEMGCSHRKSDEIIYLHLEMAHVPVRSGELNPKNNELLRENMSKRRWSVNPDGWGDCETLEEVEL
jgi:hypothetical protein